MFCLTTFSNVMFDNNFNIFLPEPVLLYDGSKQVSSLFTCKGVHLLHSIHDPDYLDTLEEFKMEKMMFLL